MLVKITRRNMISACQRLEALEVRDFNLGAGQGQRCSWGIQSLCWLKKHVFGWYNMGVNNVMLMGIILSVYSIYMVIGEYNRLI